MSPRTVVGATASLGSQSTSSADLGDYLSERGLELDPQQSNHVRWAIGTPSHPRHWTIRRKVYNVVFIMVYEAFEAAMSTVGASAAVQARSELGCSNTVSYLAFTTTFILGEGLAGLVFPPLSESFGRKWQFVVSSALFCLFNGLSAISSIPAIAVMRLLAGFAGGVPPSISPGSLEDLFSREGQVWIIFAWATASNVGLVLGPIASGYLVDALGWQWLFYIATIFSACVFIMSLFFDESRPSVLMSRSLRDLYHTTGITLKPPRPELEHDTALSWHNLITQTLTLPLRLLFSEPTILIASALNALAFALIYLLTEALPLIYPLFGLSIAATNLAFIAVLTGVLLSTILRTLDYLRISRLSRNDKIVTPEHKISSLLVSAPLLLIGLWTFAWTIPPALSPSPAHPHVYLLSMAALIPIGIAANDFDTVLAGYLVDCYGERANSAFASVTWMRAGLSVAVSLGTDGLWRALGGNGAASVVAGLGVVVAVAAGLLWWFGARFRRKSRFARGVDVGVGEGGERLGMQVGACRC